MNLTREQLNLLNRILDMVQGVHSVPDPEKNAANAGENIFKEFLRMDRQDVLQIIKELNTLF